MNNKNIYTPNIIKKNKKKKLTPRNRVKLHCFSSNHLKIQLNPYWGNRVCRWFIKKISFFFIRLIHN